MKILCLFLLCASLARADVYKSTDSSGNVIFSDHPSRGAEKLYIPPAPPAPQKKILEEVPAEPSAEPAAEQKPADATEEERKALQGRLDAETRRLEKAKAELGQAQEAILSTERNSQSDIDRTAAIEDEIALHEKAIEDLRKRISDLK